MNVSNASLLPPCSSLTVSSLCLAHSVPFILVCSHPPFFAFDSGARQMVHNTNICLKLEASLTTLINKPKGNRFCKYNMFLWVQMCTSIVRLHNASDSLRGLNLALFKIPKENGYMCTIISSIPELSLILVFLAIVLIDYITYSKMYRD